MYTKKYTVIFIIFLLALLSFDVSGQDEVIDKKEYSKELLELHNPWITTDNFSGLFLLQNTISEIYASYNTTSGDFAKSMEADDINQFSIGTYSYQKYKSIGLYGEFKYTNAYEDGVKWADMLAPYNGTPFIIGDMIGGDYHKEFFHLKGGIASNLCNENTTWGVGIEYISGSGGKDNDPRPLNKLMKARITPGFTLKVNDMRLGFNLMYAHTKEEINIRSFVDNEYYKIYQYRGLSLFTFDDVTSFTRNYFTDIYGGNIQIAFNLGSIKNITEFGFSYKKEEVEDGQSTIKDFGTYEEEKIGFNTSFIYEKNDFIHKLGLEGGFYDRLGTINVLRRENEGFGYVWTKYGENKDYTQKESAIALNYALYKMAAKYKQDWKADLKVEFIDQNTKYKFDPETFEQDIQGIDTKIGFTKNFTINNKSNLLVNLYSGYKFNLDKKLYVLNELNKEALQIENIDEYIVSSIVDTDYAWITSDVFKLGTYLKYAFDLNIRKNLTAAYIKLAADYFSSNEGMFDGENRTYLTATVGLVF